MGSYGPAGSDWITYDTSAGDSGNYHPTGAGSKQKIGNPVPFVGSYLTYTVSSRQLNLSAAFSGTNVIITPGDEFVVTEGTSMVPGPYLISRFNNANTITLAPDGRLPTTGTTYTDVAGYVLPCASVVCDSGKRRAIPTSLTSVTYTASTRVVQKTGAFSAWRFVPGDRFCVNGGTGHTAGTVADIASRTDDDNIVLVSTTGLSGSDNSNTSGFVIPKDPWPDYRPGISTTVTGILVTALDASAQTISLANYRTGSTLLSISAPASAGRAVPYWIDMPNGGFEVKEGFLVVVSGGTGLIFNVYFQRSQ